MRTRILNKMTNTEVEEYLDRGGDLIFVAVGTVEVHGDLPLDCETIIPEAFAVEFAKKADGLALINLPYFFPGATPVGRGTVNINVEDGIRYLKTVARSLMKQGFRRQVYLTLHGPAYLTVNGMCMDFFHETQNPIMHCELMHAMQVAEKNGWNAAEKNPMERFNTMIYGAYKLMGQLEYIPVYTDNDQRIPDSKKIEEANKKQYYINELQQLAHAPGSFGFYFYDTCQHTGGGEASSTVEEREQRAAEGEELITSLVECFDIGKYVGYLNELDRLVNDEIIVKYPHLGQ